MRRTKPAILAVLAAGALGALTQAVRRARMAGLVRRMAPSVPTVFWVGLICPSLAGRPDRATGHGKPQPQAVTWL